VGLGTDGFGRSDGRSALRDFFEVDARHVVVATLSTLAREGKIASERVEEAIRSLKVDSSRPDPTTL